MTIPAIVALTLNDFGYPFEVKSGSDFRFRLCTDPKRFWRSQMIVDGDIIRSITFLTDDLYLSHQRQFVLETACRLNAMASVLGGWHFDWDSGSCEYRFGLDLRGVSDVRQSITQALNTVAFPVKLWERCFARRDSRHSVRAAVNASLIELSASNHQAVSDDTRRVLLRVVDGGKSPKLRSIPITGEIERSLQVLVNELGNPNISLNPS
jgi:hypothetical protein